MEAIKEPWERIDASEETVQRMFSDWGRYCTRNKLFNKANRYYNESLQIRNDDANVLCYRSQLKRLLGQPKNALEDSKAAAQIDKRNATINMEVCDGLYDCNDLENFKIELHDNTRKFWGNTTRAFNERICVVNENFNDSIGDSLSPFILQNEKCFPTVLEEEHRRNYPDKRPLWKQLMEQDKCDVLSILDKEDVLLSPREIARRQLASNDYSQIYLNKSWKDMQFLKKMRENPNLQLPQSQWSTPLLRDLTHSGYDRVKKFAKMLQTRSPVYNEIIRRCPKKYVCQRQRDDYLFWVQYQTRRNMDSILRNIRELRAEGKIERLSNYVEEVMGDYVVLKTNRVMPWKFEFLVEVYNILALAHTDRYSACKNPTGITTHERLLDLLHMPHEKQKDIVMFVFGDRSTFQEPDAVDNKFIAYKNFIARMEKRTRFAKYDIEKAYLLHEIARSHLKQSRFDECCSIARRAIEEAKNWGSNIWEFVSYLLILKASAVQGKIERFKAVLEDVKKVVEHLKNPDLTAFIEQCESLNEQQVVTKKFTQSQSSLKFRGSRRGSLYSQRIHSSRGTTLTIDTEETE